uniref:Uncharacterized protein n=1 Tax=Rhizophora mucronata TaxID=61149 RepID=A0A2P2PIM1_RHIMU
MTWTGPKLNNYGKSLKILVTGNVNRSKREIITRNRSKYGTYKKWQAAIFASASRTHCRTTGFPSSSLQAPTPRLILVGQGSARKASVTPEMGSLGAWRTWSHHRWAALVEVEKHFDTPAK